MPATKISAETELAVAPATNDVLPIVDVSDTTDAASGTTKKITVANLFTTPTIGDMTNAQHNHENAAGGGQIDSDALSGAVSIAKGGTGQTTNTAAFDALAPTTTQGDIIYHNGSDNIRLAKGTALQQLRMNSDATALEWAVPIPAFYQRVAVVGATTGSMYGFSANTSGSVFVTYQNTTTTEIHRYERDTNTGMYVQTHVINPTPALTPYSSIIIIGNYVYLFYDSSNDIVGYRYDLADLTNEAALTVPTIDTAGANYQVNTWTDGTYLYLAQNKASNTGNRWSISGTTLSASATSNTNVDFDTGAKVQFMYDGTNIYQIKTTTDGSFTIKKATDAYFNAATTTTKLISYELDAVVSGAVAIPIDTNRMYIGYQMDANDETAARKQIMVFIPITKP